MLVIDFSSLLTSWASHLMQYCSEKSILAKHIKDSLYNIYCTVQIEIMNDEVSDVCMYAYDKIV